MKLIKATILIITGLFFFWLTSGIYAGGADPAIDPNNGCFERVGYSGNEIETEQKDFLVHRNKYRLIIAPDKFMVFTQCWQGRAKCIQVPIECVEDGKVVYTGLTWFWR